MKAKEKYKSILFFALSLSLILSHCSFVIYATESETETDETQKWIKNISWDAFCNNFAISQGIIVDTSSALWEDIKIFWKSAWNGRNYFQDNSDGTVNVCCEIPADAIEEIRDLLKQYIEEQEPYKVYNPTKNSATRGVVDALGNIPSSSIVALTTYFNQFSGNMFTGNAGYNWYRFTVFDSSKYMYAYYDNGYITLVDKNLMPAYAYTSATVHATQNPSATLYPNKSFTYDELIAEIEKIGVTHNGKSNTLGVSINTSQYALRLLTRTTNGEKEFYIEDYYGMPITVFDSSSSLAEWIVKNPIAYTTTNFNMPINTNLTLDPTTINKYNDELMQKIYNQLVENGKNAVSAQELQKIIDDTVTEYLKQINGNIEDVEEETKETNKWLEKIFNQDKDFYNKFFEYDKDILQELKDANKEFADMKDYLKNISNKLGILTALTGADLLVDLFGEDVNADLAQVGNSFTSVELMKTKFPFSLPFELYAIFNLFASEPVTPKFVIPLKYTVYDITFDNEITVDFEEYTWISDYFRGILTVVFIVGLYTYTNKNIIKK